MKKIFPIFISLLVFTAAFAQPKDGQREAKTPEQRAEKQTQMMKERLQLNEKQTTQLYDVNLKYAKEAQSAMEKEKGQREDRKQMMLQRNSEVLAILTPTQKTAYDRLTTDARSHREGEKRHKKRDKR